MLYILFFPLVSFRANHKGDQLSSTDRADIFKDIPWVQAGQLLITGLFFKLFCANNLAQITSLMAPEVSSNSEAVGGGDKLFMLFVYSFQIYADFFGFTSIALGLALLFWYRLCQLPTALHGW